VHSKERITDVRTGESFRIGFAGGVTGFAHSISRTIRGGRGREAGHEGPPSRESEEKVSDSARLERRGEGKRRTERIGGKKPQQKKGRDKRERRIF